MADGGEREVRVAIDTRTLKWQFKRTDEERWDDDGKPTREEWDALEDILVRRSGRGRQLRALALLRRMRTKKGV